MLYNLKLIIMRKTYLTLVLLFMSITFCLAQSNRFINLTPTPKQMTIGNGDFALPAQFDIAVGNLPDSICQEASRFANVIAQTTGYRADVKKGGKKSAFKLIHNSECAPEGYQLNITPKQVTIEANTTAGFFYAFQTILKLLPPHVMAGVADAEVSNYTLPVVNIQDEPRFWYRGFMLDCGRHFFSIKDIKHILDGMARYKLNFFHWHLTEDQGWRFEVKRYPKLTSVGSIAKDCRMNDMEKGYYWLGHPYGPYFYTQDECKEIVEYARKLHIEVIPEIDMPGHITAAMAAYPEFSCTPDSLHEVQTYQGGVHTDVLNVGNEKAVEFARHILEEVMDVFPSRFIHIGGDECPTKAWEENADCQQLLQHLYKDGTIKTSQSFRPLQSYFISEMGKLIQSRGRQMALWNESITAENADLDLVRQTEATIFCWYPCQQGAEQAARLGLDAVITEFQKGCYYINRKQHNLEGEPQAAGKGGEGDQLPATYAYVPVPAQITDPALRAHYVGVQACFWTEHVCDINYCDYLAYPRLLAIAESGWSPQENKNWESFRQRITADAAMLDKAGVLYGKHFLIKNVQGD